MPTLRRKDEHLAVCLEQQVEFRKKRTWFEHVEFVHQAVPGSAPKDINLSMSILGRTLSAPFLIGAMTGGTAGAQYLNQKLAAVAAAKGIGLAVGSQRAMLEDASVTDTYRVREVAPNILLLGNIGLAQAIARKPEEIAKLVDAIGADGLCLHLNTAMEMFQDDGDEFDEGGYDAIARLSGVLGERLIVKEIGCGISRETARRLALADVRGIDVAGAGGTSWVRVENLRRGSVPAGMEEFEEWGIPTAASLLEVHGLGLSTIASGGLRTGLDLAKAFALGAHMGSAALPVLRALKQGGTDGAMKWVDSLIAGLRAAMVLVGCHSVRALRGAPIVLSGPLLEWAEQRRLWRPTRERT